MKGPIAWFARNGVAANLVLVLLVAGGLLTLPGIRQEVFPEFSSDVITVTVPYPGAAPVEVEEGICVRIEEQIQGIEGIKRMTSNAAESVGTVTVEVLPEYDTRRVLDDVKSQVDAIDTFPEEAEKPIVQEVLLRRQVINVAVSGDVGEKTLRRTGEQVRDEILNLEGITQVELVSVRPYEISIEVSEDALRRHSLTFDDVARAVRRSSLDLPGGSVKTGGGEILLRSKGQAYRGPEFEGLVLLTRADGSRLLLRDVARVVDGFADTDQSSRFDGRPAALVQVFRVGEQGALEISDAVHGYVKEAQSRMPQGIRLTTWQDDSEVLRSRIELLTRNGRSGLILVLIVLALFLRLRVAFWVSVGIPVAFLGAFWLMPNLDLSINLLTLFAYLVVLGIVVDDAIVVGERIYFHLQAGVAPLTAAIRGAREMAVPVVFGVLTSVAAFSPLLMVAGNTGKIFKVIPLVVIPVLMFSLLESLFVLPTHLSHVHVREGRERRGISKLWGLFQGLFTGGLDRAIHRVYRPLLDRALEWRYLTLAGALAVLILSAGLVAGGRIKFLFFPPVEADNVVALLTMPLGAPAEITGDALRRLEESAAQVRSEMDARRAEGAPSVYRHVLTSVGEQPFRTQQSRGGGRVGQNFSGSHLGEVNIQLLASEGRSVTSAEIARRWRDLTGTVPDAVELTFTSSIFSAGEAVNVQLAGPSIEQLRDAARELEERLAGYPGVYDIADSFRSGKQEIQLQIRPAAETLGLTLSDLARQVRQGFYGEEAQRIQRGRDEVKVMVRYPEERRRSLGDLEGMRIRTADGSAVPFSSVASARLGRGYSSIRRVDRHRSINVTADVDPALANANEILAELEGSFLPGLTARYPGLSYTLEGQQREQRETLESLARGFAFAMLMIYALLAVPLRSYFQPLLIMLSIPFGLVGAVGGHLLLGMDLTILSMFGIVALAGVVVNSSLVLVHYVNQSRLQGMEHIEAVRRAGIERFRPILLTTMTTYAGLTPLLLEKSMQAQFLIPMAVSLAYGVVFATFISLLMVPAGYMVLEDLRHLAQRLLGRSLDRRPLPAER